MIWLGGIVLVALLAWLLFVAGRHRFDHQPPAPRPDETRAEGSRQTLNIPAADGTVIEGWLFLPPGQTPASIVLMAPGLTGYKEGHLEQFAWKFAAAGFAVLLIDFRSFGGSGGWPRHHLDPLMQLEDYSSAIDFIRAALQTRVDTSRLVLWGSSFSGAAAICSAARDPAIAGVIAQVPYLGGKPIHAPAGLQLAGYIALSVAEILGDAVARLFGIRLQPSYITTFGRPGERAFAMSRDHQSRYGSAAPLHPFWATMPPHPRGGWENRMMVRGLKHLDKLSPKADLAGVACPVLLIGAIDDDMISIADIRDAAATLKAADSRLVQFDGGHYDAYMPPLFDTNVAIQIEFLRKAL